MKTTPSSISTGIRDLDKLMGGGLYPGSVVCIAARPAIGKTAVALTVARCLAEHGVRVSYLTSANDYYGVEHRFVSQLSGVDLCRISRCQVTRRHLPKIAEARRCLKKLPVNIGSCGWISDLGVEDYLSHAKVVVFDDVEKARLSFRESEIGRLLKLIKKYAAKTGSVAIICVGLDRRLEGRKDRRPRFTDLPADMRNFCDASLLLYRDEVYYRYTKKKGIIEVGSVTRWNRKPSWVDLRFDHRTVKVKAKRQPKSD